MYQIRSISLAIFYKCKFSAKHTKLINKFFLTLKNKIYIVTLLIEVTPTLVIFVTQARNTEKSRPTETKIIDLSLIYWSIDLN